MDTNAVNDNAETIAAIHKAADHFMEHSKLKGANNIREVNKKAYTEVLGTLGVAESDVKRVQEAINITTTAASEVAMRDLETRLKGASAEDLASDDYRRSQSATVRLPTHGGSTEVTQFVETSSPIPFKQNEEGTAVQQHKISHGRTRVKINATGRIDPSFTGAAADRMRKALGIADA